MQLLEGVLFEFFWMTGFREGEVMHVTWPDIDFGNHVVRVKAKPKLGFIPKDWEEREVPIPDRLLNSLRRHKAAAPANHALVLRPATAACSQLPAPMQKHRLACRFELWLVRHRGRALRERAILPKLVSA